METFHRLPECLSVEHGELRMDGNSLCSLAHQYGTPLFVFSRRQIEANVGALRRAFHKELPTFCLYYACKANSNRSILTIMREMGLNLEVNSGGELWKGLQVGFRGEQLLFNGVAKTNSELERALAANCTVIIDSISEMKRCVAMSQYLGRVPRLLLRLMPGIRGSTTDEFQMGTADLKFGMTTGEAYQALQLGFASSEAMEIGLHLHLGGQLSDAIVFADAVGFVQQFLANAQRLHPAHRWSPSVINLGGGLPCCFTHLPATAEQLTRDEQAILSASLDLEAVARAVRPLGEQGYTVAMEPGRFLVANAAVLLTRVVNEKRREGGEQWLLLDGGCNLLMDVFIYRWLFELVHPGRITEPHRTPYQVGGPLCDAADVFQGEGDGDHRPGYRGLPVGTGLDDTLAFLDVGAYSLEQMNEYNGQLMPAALLVDGGRVRLIRRRQNLEELFQYDPA